MSPTPGPPTLASLELAMRETLAIRGFTDCEIEGFVACHKRHGSLRPGTRPAEIQRQELLFALPPPDSLPSPVPRK